METYIPDESNKQLPYIIHFHNLYDDGDGLRINVISGDVNELDIDGIIEIAFSRTFAYRNLDEGARLKTYNHTKSFPNIPIFTVENSSFLQYFHEESMGGFRDFGLIHYYISTTDDCIDVLTTVRPIITRKNF